MVGKEQTDSRKTPGWLGNLICETLIVQSKLPPSNFLHYIALGTIHVLCNQDLGFSDSLPFVITFSTERNRKLRFSDPSSPFFDYVIHGCSPTQSSTQYFDRLDGFLFENQNNHLFLMNKQKKKYREINNLVFSYYHLSKWIGHKSYKKSKNNHLSFFIEQAKNNIAKKY